MIEIAAAALGVRSGGGGVSHSGRMSAEYTVTRGFWQKQGISVDVPRDLFYASVRNIGGNIKYSMI